MKSQIIYGKGKPPYDGEPTGQDIKNADTAFEYTVGVLLALTGYVVRNSVFVIICWLLLKIIYNSLGLGTDNSDLDGWHRSGMSVHTDQMTGVQYLSVPGGGVHVRVDKDGKPITSTK